jgi:DMSO/TMAO reductase YedYZ molybdopterin-dependent catalytic subunit
MKEQLISTSNYQKRTVIAFASFLMFLTACVFIWVWLRHEQGDSPMPGSIPVSLRKGLNTNEKIFSTVFSPVKLATTYPKSEAVRSVRVNGNEGLKTTLDSSSWRLQVIKNNGDTSFYTLDDIKKLPKTEVVFDFKCIEGWSQKTWWGGVKFADFIKYYHLENETSLNFAGLKTPDGEYYVGVDMPSIMHPQTLLCYEMNGKPLPINQGYPLRLIIPVKYGIKHLKRIGTIYFSNQRPPDYWAERGYDYYAGH